MAVRNLFLVIFLAVHLHQKVVNMRGWDTKRGQLRSLLSTFEAINAWSISTLVGTE